ncbi:MAG: hypothetical protein IKL92_02370, partial [Oscillospiraceae bacterium]|nr:hypothetical protein [Oscillospiraceae bacterium]
MYNGVGAAEDLVYGQTCLLACDIVESDIKCSLGRAVAVNEAVHQLMSACNVKRIKANESIGKHLHDNVAGFHGFAGDESKR